ncbi:hypothetical protein BK816_01705 [Boudabousia tangfeifanii]|uniref:Glutathione S-transferase n=1 Tax=Boudabousia tangfeifanii TaxID=1912795 RepID=A0A1D9MJ09_9ACTO|nr:glutathione S-transferase family protein [Boudabousia tangfeifanii]AOZ72170.1 hypothetical protein BK816_01705 [Boudabousia tangfeifanii]
MSLVLHHLNDSRSFRIAWALTELGADFELVKHQRGADLLAPDSLKQVHPLGKSPVLEDDGKQYIESQCILEHLSETHDGRLSAKQDDPRMWLTFTESSLMPMLVMGLVLKTAAKQAPKILQPVFKPFVKGISTAFTGKNAKADLEFLNGYLTKHNFLSDDDQFGIADIQMEFAIYSAEGAGFNLGEYPAIRRWLTELHERPAYQQALSRAGR